MSTAVVLMAYGSPNRIEDVPAYYADIRGGRPIKPEHLDGPGRALQAARDRGVEPAERDHRGDARGARGRARPARLHRHAPLEAADRRGGRAGARGRRRHDRRPRARAALLEPLDREVPGAARGRARRPRRASLRRAVGRRARLRRPARGAACVLRNTSTSSSRRTRFPPGSSTRAIRTATSCSRRRGSWRRRPSVEDWSFSFQSESPTGEPWLGPDILDHLDELAARGVEDVVVCPVGFVADHLEIRWDLDVEAAEKARELGLRFDRIELPNADPAFVHVLAGLVRRAAAVPSAGVKTGQIRVEGVSRRFRVRANEARSLKELFVLRGRTEASDVLALQDVSLAVEPGEAVGLVGRNGSGKSTLLRLVAGIIKPTEGRVAVGGRIGSLLELGAGFHPDFSGRENVFLNGAIYGLRRAQIRERFDEIVAFAELEQAIDRPVRTYSSGMYMRLGFAIAAHLDADVLLLDEVFAVGDEAFQRKCFGKVFEFKQRGGTIVFVSHDASQVERLCERAVLLHEGRLEFDGPTHEAIVRYRKALAAEADPAERAAGLREWGTGEATIAAARLVGAGRGGAAAVPRRRAVLAAAPDRGGERDRAAAAPARAARRRRACSSPRTCSTPAASAGPPARGALRYDIDRLPLSDGRFHLRLGLADGEGSAAALARRRARLPRLPGRRGARRRRAAGRELDRGGELRRPMSSRTLSRLARPDGDRSRPPVHALHGRRGAAAGRRADDDRPRLARRRRDLLRPRARTSSTPSTPTRRWPRRSARRTGTSCGSTPTAAPAPQRRRSSASESVLSTSPAPGAAAPRRRDRELHVAEPAHRVRVGRADDLHAGGERLAHVARRRGRAGPAGRSPPARRPSRARPRRPARGRARSRAGG